MGNISSVMNQNSCYIRYSKLDSGDTLKSAKSMTPRRSTKAVLTSNITTLRVVPKILEISTNDVIIECRSVELDKRPCR